MHKANVLKALTGIFLEAGREVAKKYEGRVDDATTASSTPARCSSC